MYRRATDMHVQYQTFTVKLETFNARRLLISSNMYGHRMQLEQEQGNEISCKSN